MNCVEESTCDIVGTFRRPPPPFGGPAVIWRPHSESAPGELRPPCTPVVTPLLWGHHATLVFIEKMGAPEQLCLKVPKSLIWHCGSYMVNLFKQKVVSQKNDIFATETLHNNLFCHRLSDYLHCTNRPFTYVLRKDISTPGPYPAFGHYGAKRFLRRAQIF